MTALGILLIVCGAVAWLWGAAWFLTEADELGYPPLLVVLVPLVPLWIGLTNPRTMSLPAVLYTAGGAVFLIGCNLAVGRGATAG